MPASPTPSVPRARGDEHRHAVSGKNIPLTTLVMATVPTESPGPVGLRWPLRPGRLWPEARTFRAAGTAPTGRIRGRVSGGAGLPVEEHGDRQVVPARLQDDALDTLLAGLEADVVVTVQSHALLAADAHPRRTRGR